jgi:predicted DNA binding protein
MSLIAEFRVQSPKLALAESLSAVPEMELELIQEIGTDPERPFLFTWASGDDFETFESAMAEDVTVADVQRYTEVEESILYRMRVTDQTEVVSYPVWVELGADQLDASYADGWWHNRMRFPDREALGAIQEWCEQECVSFDLRKVYTDDPGQTDPTDLSEAQQEALEVAYRAGYFEVPREASVDEIAAELDVSGQAVSERLRRAHRTLVARHVLGDS